MSEKVVITREEATKDTLKEIYKVIFKREIYGSNW